MSCKALLAVKCSVLGKVDVELKDLVRKYPPTFGKCLVKHIQVHINNQPQLFNTALQSVY